MIPAGRFHAGRWGRSEPASQSGRPLPGRTPPQLVSQLIYRALGPYPADVRPVLDLHGMCGRPAVSKSDTAARNDLPLRTLRHLHEQVITQAHHDRLDPAITAAASTRSGMFDDHQGRPDACYLAPVVALDGNQRRVGGPTAELLNLLDSP